MKNKSEAAVEMMAAGYNCAQSVLGVFCEEFGLKLETAMKLANGFGGGMARKQEVCGAVSGGAMVLGLQYGRGPAFDKAATEDAYQRIGEFMNRFAGKHGSCLCRKLLTGYDLQNEEGRRKYKEDGLGEKICRPLVADAVGLLQGFLASPGATAARD
jgi:C_GCAxxG_C_C family probable redox protein